MCNRLFIGFFKIFKLHVTIRDLVYHNFLEQVRRVQHFVDALDTLKVRNSNPFNNSSNAASVTTKWETFDSGVGCLSAPTPMPSSTEVNQDWEHFD